MKRFFLLSLFVAAFAFAKDRTLTVLEASVVVTGGDVQVTADGGCDAVARIAPIADQRSAKVQRWSAEACKVFKMETLKGAKVDQGFAK